MSTTRSRALLYLEGDRKRTGEGQVSWLMDHRFTAPSRPEGQWLYAVSLPIDSGGTAPDLHRLPFSLPPVSERPFTYPLVATL